MSTTAGFMQLSAEQEEEGSQDVSSFISAEWLGDVGIRGTAASLLQARAFRSMLHSLNVSIACAHRFQLP